MKLFHYNPNFEFTYVPKIKNERCLNKLNNSRAKTPRSIVVLQDVNARGTSFSYILPRNRDTTRIFSVLLTWRCRHDTSRIKFALRSFTDLV